MTQESITHLSAWLKEGEVARRSGLTRHQLRYRSDHGHFPRPAVSRAGARRWRADIVDFFLDYQGDDVRGTSKPALSTGLARSASPAKANTSCSAAIDPSQMNGCDGGDASRREGQAPAAEYRPSILGALSRLLNG